MKQKLLLFSFWILCMSFVFPQETGKFGFFFKVGSSNSVGLNFNISDRVTLRPSFGFQTFKREYESPNASDSNGHSYSVDLGLFYHFLKKDRFTAYSGLEVGYTYQKQEIEIVGISDDMFAVRKTRGYRGNVIFGLQYNFNKHLAVFGEVAFGFLKEKVGDLDMPQYMQIISYPSESIIWELSRSGFGIILYL